MLAVIHLEASYHLCATDNLWQKTYRLERHSGLGTLILHVFAVSIEKHGLSVTGRIATLNTSLHL